MNKVILIGNLTRDPELSETASGTAYCRISIAVNRPYSGEDGEKQVDFFNITIWKKQAENCARYLKKGNKISIVGTLQNRSYEDKNGNNRTITEIIANEIEYLVTSSLRADNTDNAENNINKTNNSYNRNSTAKQDSFSNSALYPIDEEDLPF